MKILAIGDFHGRFPEKLKIRVLKEQPDIILSTGDYAGISDFRPALKKMFRESAKGNEFSFEEYFGRERYKKLLKKDFEAGKVPIRELNKFRIPVVSVFGNGDWYNVFFNDTGKFYEKDIKKLKNIKDITRGRATFNKIKISGFGGYLDPDIYFTRRGMKAINAKRGGVGKRRKRYNKWERELMKVMSNRPDILLAHYTPYKCLDKMKEKGFMLTGQNMGVSSYNRAIEKYRPALVVCGHMHENPGKCTIGKTIVVNPGAASEGRAAIIEFDEKNKKVLSVRFVK